MRFKAWKQLFLHQKNKERLIKRTIEHWNKAKMTQVRAAFKVFITLEVQKQKKVAIK